MTHYDNTKPDEAPETVLAADGKTVLRKFSVDAVIYAPDQAHAQRRLDHAHIYFDAARLRSEE